MKKRLDILLVERKLTDSREKAKRIIMAGNVYINGQKFDKPGTEIEDNCKIDIKGEKLKYVSRGGLKLEKALQTFSIRLDNKCCMDIGASTGGFTDCMLQNGALKVYSIDVGYGQLAWKLRCNEKVINIERTNFRYIHEKENIIKDKIDFASVDVSFISLSLILPNAYSILSDVGEMVCLIKPQFEAGKDKIGKKGVVKDSSVHFEVIKNIFDFVKSNGFYIYGIDYSPIKGPEGNIEYLMYIKKIKNNDYIDDNIIKKVVIDSHSLNKN